MSIRFALRPWLGPLFWVLLGNTQIATAAIAFVQSKNNSPNNSSMTSISATFAAAQTAGNLNVVAIAWGPSSVGITSVTDTKGNAYTLAVGPTISSGAAAAIYYAKNIAAAAAGANAVTVTFNAAAGYPDIRIAEYSGINTTSPLDVTAVATGTGTLGDSGYVTTTYPNDLLIGANWVSTGTNAAGANYTQREISSYDGDILEDRIVTSTGSYNATAPVTPSGNWIMQMAAFKAASTPDTQAPTAPSGLQLSSTPTSSQIALTWTGSTDNVGVTGYLVERCQGASCSNFSQIGAPGGVGFNDTTVSPSTTYSYRVRATDAAPNLSGYSNTLTATSAAAPGTPIAFVQSKNNSPNNSSMTSISATFTAAQTAGNFNVVAIAWGPSSVGITSVTDTKGNTYSLAVGPTTSSGAAAAIYYAKNIAAATAGANTVKVTFSAAAGYPDIRIAEYSGINSTSPLDVTAVATGTGTLGDSGYATTTNSNDLLVGANWVSTGTNAAGAGYTQREISSYDGDILEDRIVGATGSYNATAPVTPSGNWIMQMAAFKGISSGLAAPTGLTSTVVSSNQINLSWSASSGATKYLIERCASASCNYLQIDISTTTSYSDTGLFPATGYSYRVRATNGGGSLSGYSNTSPASTQAAGPAHATVVNYIYDDLGRLTQVQYDNGGNYVYGYDAAGNRNIARSSIDTAGPSVPTGLAGTSPNPSLINLTWTASTDTGGSLLQGYKIYRDGAATPIGTSPTNSYADTTVVGSRTYSYTVSAYDYAGHNSAQSSSASVSTPDITPPTAPSGLSMPTHEYNRVVLTWVASTDTGGSGLAGYRIVRLTQDGPGVGATTTFSATSNSYTDTTVGKATLYTYSVSAYDGAGNTSASVSVTQRTDSGIDHEPPTVPGGLTGTAVAWNQINLSWTASTDNVGVQGYKISRDGVLIGTTASTTYSSTGLSDATQYNYKVVAYDYAVPPNVSSPPAEINVTTPLAVPSVPTGLTIAPSGIAYGGGFSVSWDAVTNAPVTYYNLQETVLVGNVVTTYPINAPQLSVNFSKGTSDDNRYKYAVQACTARTCSAFSALKAVSTCPSTGCL